jgi:hypothetical protein
MIKIGGTSFFKFEDSIGGRSDHVTMGEGFSRLNWLLSQSIPIEFASPFIHKSLWAFASTRWKFSSLMCQHGMECEGFFFLFCVHFINKGCQWHCKKHKRPLF